MTMLIPVSGLLLNGPLGKETLRLEEPLGNGAFGVVFKAKDITTGDYYAVKFPQFVFFGGPTDLTAFLNEVQAAREIQHLNVAQVFYVETSEAEVPPYLVMEFIGGGTLKSRLDMFRSDNTYLSLEALRNLSDGLIDGISAINARMLHRDLKPDNILMSGDVPKIADFGLSKIVGAATRSATFKGGQHILYMAPEGWKLETNEIQIDMYSMGIILYELAALRYPYELPSDLNDINTIRDMHLFQQPKPLQTIRQDIPIGFVHIVSRLMEKNPRARFSDWSGTKQALEKAWLSSTVSSTTQKGSISALLEVTERIHHIKTQERLEQEKLAQEEMEQSRLDQFHRDNLLSVIKNKIDEFNEQSTLGLIRVSISRRMSEVGTHTFSLPFGGTLELDFFRIKSPLKLSIGSVRFAGHLHGPKNIGLNYLLCRGDSPDLYGKWIVCRARQNPNSQRTRLIEPFGFSDREIQEIERSDHAMHIYLVEYDKSDNSPEESFLEIALAILKQGN